MMWRMRCMRKARAARSSCRTWAWSSPTRGWWWGPSWWRASSTWPSTSVAGGRGTGTGGETTLGTSWHQHSVHFMMFPLCTLYSIHSVHFRYGHGFAGDDYGGYYRKRAVSNGEFLMLRLRHAHVTHLGGAGFMSQFFSQLNKFEGRQEDEE